MACKTSKLQTFAQSFQYQTKGSNISSKRRRDREFTVPSSFTTLSVLSSKNTHALQKALYIPLMA